MGEHIIKLPDVGEGVAEAELVEWHVKVGDLVREDTVLAAVMTDKATVEIPVAGRRRDPLARGGDRRHSSDRLADRAAESGRRGQCCRRLEVVRGHGGTDPTPNPTPRGGTRYSTEIRRQARRPQTHRQERNEQQRPNPASPPCGEGLVERPPVSGAPRPEGEKPLASPAVRLRAREAGIDLRQVTGIRSGRPHPA